MRTTRPAELFREWVDKQGTSWGCLKMHGVKNRAHISIHADFDRKSAGSLRRMARWMLRAAAYMEQINGR